MNKIPLKQIPEHLYDKYTMNGLVQIRYNDESGHSWYFNETYFSEKLPVWDNIFMQDYLNDFTVEKILNFSSKKWCYGFGHLNILNSLFGLNNLGVNFLGKKIAVIGSQNPWVECICLNLGINDVTTVDYNPPICESNIIQSISIETFLHNQDKYDIILSFSSIEHSGLGRYGDPLDPDADLKTTALIHDKLKDDGFFILAVPIGKDAIEWNAHRIYGPIRFPKLINNFEIIDFNFYGYFQEKIMNMEIMEKIVNTNEFDHNFQPVFVLKKC